MSLLKIDEANMNENDENKLSSGHKSTDYLGNCCIVIPTRFQSDIHLKKNQKNSRMISL